VSDLTQFRYYRTRVMQRIATALRPHEVKKPEEIREMVEGMALVMATCFMKERGLPYSGDAVAAFARAAIDGMERQAALESN
jgi:hypothetical protein